MTSRIKCVEIRHCLLPGYAHVQHDLNRLCVDHRYQEVSAWSLVHLLTYQLQPRKRLFYSFRFRESKGWRQDKTVFIKSKDNVTHTRPQSFCFAAWMFTLWNGRYAGRCRWREMQFLWQVTLPSGTSSKITCLWDGLKTCSLPSPHH